MAKKVTITIPVQPTKDKPATTAEVSGPAYNVRVGPSQKLLRIVITDHNYPYTITHRESGQAIGRYNPLYRYVSNPYARQPSPREFAIERLEQIIAKCGEDKFWSVVNAAPKINK